MKKYIYILILFFCSVSFSNDELARQYEYADKLFNDQNYFEAITEFKRLSFFDEKNVYAYESNYKIGIAYKYGGFYDNSVFYLSHAIRTTENIDERIQAEFQIVRCNILRKTTDRALQLLSQMEKDSVYSNHQNEIHYWKGWSYMISDRWDSAAESFANISDDHELKILSEQVSNDKYSVTFARVISYILPGAGQFYTGNYLSGLMSLAWNVLWGYLTINSFIENRAFDGVAIGSLLWLRFYRGNIQNAEKLAVQKNIEIANTALLYLMENYRGEKP
ncbi:MAG TPA: hypothetical protein ENN33_10630 [Ignavibacteria bacterium]|nr:hypothetical protein [Ignavibacteria bacterium]